MKNVIPFALVMAFISLPIFGFTPLEHKKYVLPVEIQNKPIIDTTDVLQVKASYYYASSKECDSTPTVTASGAVIDTLNATELHWCAISWDLHKRYGGMLKFGDVIEVYGKQGKKVIKGKYIVKDLMNPRWKKKIDILLTKGDKSVTFDSVKVKNKKIKEYKKQQRKERRQQKFQDYKQRKLNDAKTASKKIVKQAGYTGIIKFFSFIPYVGR